MTEAVITSRSRPVSTLAETLAVLRANEQRIRALGATALYVYGSAARDELQAESDVDLFVDYDPASTFSFVELFDLRDLMAERLGRNVDLTTRKGLHPRLSTRIEATAVRAI
jgi:hypothetical protein